MSKELEAIKILKANAILFDDGTDFGASMLEAINDLDIYLTPPTEEEVCKALSEYIGDKVIYIDDTFQFGSIVIVTLYNDNTIGFNISLPPHLITLIGRFYEGESK